MRACSLLITCVLLASPARISADTTPQRGHRLGHNRSTGDSQRWRPTPTGEFAGASRYGPARRVRRRRRNQGRVPTFMPAPSPLTRVVTCGQRSRRPLT